MNNLTGAMDNPNWYYWEGTDLILKVQVQPRARHNELIGIQGDALKIRLAAPPVDGKANEQLQRFLADLFALPLTRINLISGASSRNKRLRITSPLKIPAILQSWI